MIFFLHISIYASTDILKQSEIFIDTNNKYTIDTISTAKFTPSNISKINIGYTDSTIWIKFSITNETTKNINKVLLVDNYIMDNIILFTENKNSYKKEEKGVLHDRNFQNIINHYFDIEINPNETKNYYLKISSISTAIFFKVQLMKKDELYKQEMIHQLILTIFLSALAILIIYNLFIFLFTKDLAYLYYIFYLIFTELYILSASGMCLYIYPVEFEKTDAFLTIFYIGFSTIASLLFSREFLQIKNYKKIDFIFKTIIILIIFIIVFTSPEFYPLEEVNVLLLFSLFFMVGSSYYLHFKKVQNAKYIFIGWTIALIGWVMHGSFNSNLFSLVNYFPYFFEICMIIEAILFSIALSAKLNKTKELEIAVNKSEILTKELHHRVKNNMQFIISMYRLKLSKLMDKKLSSILNEIELTIQAMSATHEMLYAKSDLKKIDTKEYFESLITRISKSFNLKEIKIKTDIDTKLGIDQSIALGIILNELITNSLKYAFVDRKGEINISLKTFDKKYELTYKDNGVGFDKEDTKKSFGLRLINNLVRDELKGSLEVDGSKGSFFKIVF
jgi:two-component sensor histidine kinase